jgi:hypothetical protein
MGEKRNEYRTLVGKRNLNYHMGFLGINEKIMWKLTLNKQVVRGWADFNWLGTGYIGNLL